MAVNTTDLRIATRSATKWTTQRIGLGGACIFCPFAIEGPAVPAEVIVIPAAPKTLQEGFKLFGYCSRGLFPNQ
jgi:hypothetical protein